MKNHGLFHWLFIGFSLAFHVLFMGFSWGPLEPPSAGPRAGLSAGVSQVFRGCFAGVSRVFRGCFAGAGWAPFWMPTALVRDDFGPPENGCTPFSVI